MTCLELALDLVETLFPTDYWLLTLLFAMSPY
jgi:hypothetical protein